MARPHCCVDARWPIVSSQLTNAASTFIPDQDTWNPTVDILQHIYYISFLLVCGVMPMQKHITHRKKWHETYKTGNVTILVAFKSSCIGKILIAITCSCIIALGKTREQFVCDSDGWSLNEVYNIQVGESMKQLSTRIRGLLPATRWHTVDVTCLPVCYKSLMVSAFRLTGHKANSH